LFCTRCWCLVLLVRVVFWCFFCWCCLLIILIVVVTVEFRPTVVTKLSIVFCLMSTFFTVFHEMPPVLFDENTLNYQVQLIILKFEIRFISRKNQKSKSFSQYKDLCIY